MIKSYVTGYSKVTGKPVRPPVEIKTGKNPKHVVLFGVVFNARDLIEAIKSVSDTESPPIQFPHW